MKIVSSMLSKWINIPSDIEAITNQKIIETESFEKINTATNLVTGHVLTCLKHPNSDHLSVTTVDIGTEILDIVCGAPNVREGQDVIVAKVGAVLPGDFIIKEAKIRGAVSKGMICSLQELGFDEKNVPERYREGIYAFDQDIAPGLDALEVISQEGFVLELGLTPNRSDLLSVLGFAYDLAAMTNQKVTLPTFNIETTKEDNPLKVTIESDGCGRYLARTIKDVTIKESPWWLKSALLSAGIRPINNVVDISNYILLDYGTPLHMFDAKKVKTDRIVVRNATSGEQVRTLDEVDRILEANDVVITDGKRPIAIGGVMGLENTMIDDQTTDVILEAAYFDPKHIEKTAKRLNLRSDASLRFERGIDDTRVVLGMERATELLVELAGGKVTKGVSKAVRYELKRPMITITKDEIDQALGITLEPSVLLDYLKRYQYDVTLTDGTFELMPPSFRNDITIKADVIEEIARIHGLDNIPETPFVMTERGKLSSRQKMLRSIRHQAVAVGLFEAITYSLVPADEATRYQTLGEPVSVMMPLSEDKKTLRQSVLYGLLSAASYNQARQMPATHLFEIGHVFAKGIERQSMAALISGTWLSGGWTKMAINADFYLMKGILETIFSPLGIDLDFRASQKNETLHPYRQALILYQGETIGTIGELHPLTAKAFDLLNTMVFELDLEPILDKTSSIQYEPISRYPSIARDLAVIVKEGTEAKTLLDLIRQTAKKTLQSVQVFDVYQGPSIGEGMTSIAFNLVFNDPERTLGGEDVDKIMKKVTSRLAFELGASVRS
ncbi:MAG: phenylalanine--tRNA ligase subunit beta [Acholeplasmataceae bacterium]|nr:phenylalanine--tRNA ligase subunit beta [Acholeplasmataceae bacterium]